MMYASNTWAPATELEMIRSALSSLQRGFAIKICRAYRTVSLTSAMILAGLLPLDLRIREAEALYKAKKGLSMDYLPPGKELEKDIANTERPHPQSNVHRIRARRRIGSRSPGKIAGPQIYTDGSKINGRVGAAITWWTNDTESEYQTLSLHPSCSVYQAEISSLELLSNPRTGHPLAHAIRESTRNANAEGKEIRFYWLRAHVGIKGNERADELAKIAAQKADADYDYEKIPLSWIKNKIREETILKWQTRYDLPDRCNNENILS
ncbi:hypothetical protein EVAR_85881_1 [Eumeta japonica]|uniref:Uncharacterized protein n=1 Tax=Eumeta variegata TaxID=151549 RepID=A0A4C2A1P9_EUMVA|nr:hypothetical protein EVAR_85881_1 [Eumeta japonica]